MGERRKRSEQADSDPLPYVQVDRAVRGRVGLLAGALGVTTQHALGALVEWWDLNGDPRALTEILEATAEGDEPAVLISAQAARDRFLLAAGKPCEPSILVHLGLLEPVADGAFRVRGMSRYFAPVQARAKARAAAANAGKASAEARRATSGTAQPVRGAVREPFDSRSGAVRTDAERPPNARRTPPNPSGQRSAVNDQLQIEDPAKRSHRGASKPRQPDLIEPPPDPRHAPLVAEFVAAFESLRKARYPFTGRDAKSVAELLSTGLEPVDLVAAWRKALVSNYPKVSTLAELKSNLAHFVGSAGGSLAGDWRSNVDHAKSWGTE